MEALTPIVSAMIAEALKTWGAYALCLVILGVGLYLVERRNRAERTEKDALIATLRGEVAKLQEQRIQDVREMIQVARSGTETMQARALGDADTRDLLRALVERLPNLSTPTSTLALLPPVPNVHP